MISKAHRDRKTGKHQAKKAKEKKRANTSKQKPKKTRKKKEL